MKNLRLRTYSWLISALLIISVDDAAFAASNQVVGPTAPEALPTLPLPAPFSPTQTLAQMLGWVPGTDAASSPGCLLCGGHYVVSPLHSGVARPGQNPKDQPTQISADQTLLSRNGVSALQGQVVVSQVGQEVQSELAYLYPDPDPHSKAYQLQNIDLIGQVLLRQNNQILMGDSGHYNLRNGSGTLSNATFEIKLNTPDPTLLPSPPAAIPEVITDKNIWEPLVGWGQAETIDQINPNLYKLQQSTYSTCVPTDPSWKLRASSMDLDKLTGRGESWNNLVYIEGVPLLYIPYMNFPIDKRRKTGFLYPTVGYESDNGFEASVPFYFNLFPNYDLLLTPEYMSERGVLTQGNFRYLQGGTNGTLQFGFIPADQGFKSFQGSSAYSFAGSNDPTIAARLNTLENDSDNRGAISWQNSSTFNENWSSTVNYNWASDDYYLNDFGGSLQQITTNQLQQQVTLNYEGEHWDFLGNVENYQTLHPVNQSTVFNSYAELPQFLLTSNYPDLPYGLDFASSTEYVDFWEQKNPGQISSPAQGSRINFQPSLSLPLTWGRSGYITPKLQLQATQYLLYDAGVSNPFVPTSASNPAFNQLDPTRVLPIFDIDSGLYFDKQTHLFGQNYTQTLEPRLMYLYVPYQNQDDIPLFDTSLPAFDYNQLFQTNRFSGTDRLSNANQISLGVTTRFLDEATGLQKASASIGQILYFEDRKVTLCRTVGCTDPAYLLGVLPNDSLTSPVAGQVTYNMTQHWSALGNVAWQPGQSLGGMQTANATLSYERDPQHVLNLGYSYLRNGDTILSAPNGVLTPVSPSGAENNFNQPYVSFAWPITDHWSTMGYIGYDISHHYAQQYFGGLQYNSCCYAVRLVASRQFQNLNQYNQPVMNNIYYAQFLLKGLGSVGSGNPNGLVSQIAGYKDPFAGGFT